jgi:ATP-binding cassette, subfamily B, bacterial
LSRHSTTQADGANPAYRESDQGKAPRTELRPLLALWPYLARYKLQLALAAIALVFSALAMLVIPMAVRRVIDLGFGTHDGIFIDKYFAMLIVIGLILALASAARFYYVNWLGERVVADLRSDVFRHVADLGPAFFERTHSGELMSRLTADTTQIKAIAGSSLSQALRSLIMLIGALVMMFVTSANLTLLVLLAIPLTVLPLIAFGRSVRRLSRRAQDTLAQASAYAAENLSASRTMQAFAHERTASDQYRRDVEVAFDAAKERMRARAVLTALAMFLVVASITGVLWFGAAAVVDGSMTVGRLSQFVLYAVFAGAAFAQVSEIWGEVSQAAGAAERLTELLAVEPEIKSPALPVALPVPARGEVEFDDVRFAYPGRPKLPTLNGISFRAAPGETIAIVGPSGAGKSTLVDLLLGLLEPTAGRITVDGRDIVSALGSWQRHIGYVPQEPFLLDDTIRRNVAFGIADAEVDDRRVTTALRRAQLGEFVAGLRDGLDTLLGERGTRLSGGQRQRVAIARALYHDPEVLVFDEATSALDTTTERELIDSLEALRGVKTLVVIAHRLSTVRRCDRLALLRDGRLAAVGSYDELIERDAAFRAMAAAH